MALKTGLVSYWKLDESSGNAADSHGSNTLTNNNTVTFVSGLLNNAAHLVRASSHYFNKDFDITGGSAASQSISAWYKPASTPSNPEYRGIVGNFLTTGGYVCMTIGHINDGVEHLDAEWQATDGTYFHATYNVSLSIGTWYHIVAVYDSSTAKLRIYVNGTQQGSDVDTSGKTIQTPNRFYIGARNQGLGQYEDGDIDEVAFWNKALSSSEVTEIYNSGSPLPYSSWDAITKILSETITHTDSILKSTIRNLSDTITHTDTVLKSTIRNLLETITHTDSDSTFMRIVEQILTETLTLTDTITKSITRVLSETLTLTDTILKATTRILSDTITLTDTFSKGFVKILTETINFTSYILVNGVLLAEKFWTFVSKSASATWAFVNKNMGGVWTNRNKS